MKTLVIYAHPNHDGHHAYFLDKVKSSLNDKKIEFEVLDLYQLNYNPVLKSEELDRSNKAVEEILMYQEKIKNSEKLIFIFPIWWQGAPAILKGFFDRTFSAGFAFMYKNGVPVGLLKGKKAAIFSASGGPRIFNKYVLGDRGVKVVAKDALGFCGIKTKSFLLGSARKVDNTNKKKMDKLVLKGISYLYK